MHALHFLLFFFLPLHFFLSFFVHFFFFCFFLPFDGDGLGANDGAGVVLDGAGVDAGDDVDDSVDDGAGVALDGAGVDPSDGAGVRAAEDGAGVVGAAKGAVV